MVGQENEEKNFFILIPFNQRLKFNDYSQVKIQINPPYKRTKDFDEEGIFFSKTYSVSNLR